MKRRVRKKGLLQRNPFKLREDKAKSCGKWSWSCAPTDGYASQAATGAPVIAIEYKIILIRTRRGGYCEIVVNLGW